MDAVTCHSCKHTAFSPEQTGIYVYKRQEYKDSISNWIAADGTARQGIHGILRVSIIKIFLISLYIFTKFVFNNPDYISLYQNNT